jgi:intracellular septation protein
MKMLFDILPVILFFAAYKIFDSIYVATGLAMVISVLQLGFVYWREKRVETLLIVVSCLIVVLGGLTLFLHNPMFIKWKPTAVTWMFALVLLGSHFFGSKSVSQHMMEKEVELPEHVWRNVNFSWALFFLIMGALNLYVVYHYDTNTWVNFKLYGMTGSSLIFVLGVAVYMANHAKDDENDQTA